MLCIQKPRKAYQLSIPISLIVFCKGYNRWEKNYKDKYIKLINDLAATIDVLILDF